MAELKAENERLREALGQIAGMNPDVVGKAVRIAQFALERPE